MEEKFLKSLLADVRTYNAEEEEAIAKAYYFAAKNHAGQKRKDGEEYITHPVAVAIILSEMRADRDTISAALLHDLIEDTDVTKEELAKNFSEDIANLVDGVSKISRVNFNNKTEANVANSRKILTSITEDVRIIIIKLADRLHNLQTLEHLESIKQKEIALESLEMYVPLAFYIGAYRLKSELEDLAMLYLKPDEFFKIESDLALTKKNSQKCLTEMLEEISFLLEKENVPFEIKIRAKNIYGIYKSLSENNKITDIHDLLALKIMVDDVKNCYLTLGLIHNQYYPLNERFKDYIALPKTNMYQSLHTTVFSPDERLVQAQIRTFAMDKIASFGLTAYWDINKGEAKNVMQADLTKKFQFFSSLNELNMMFSDDQEFINQTKKELLTGNIYVYNANGEIIELPQGATIIDMAYKIGTNIGNLLAGATVNDDYVGLEYCLKNKDRVKLLTNEEVIGPSPEWLEKVQTAQAKQKIKEFMKDKKYKR